MNTTTESPIDLEGYKQASREALESVIEKYARIEQAADLEPGSLVRGLLEFIDNEADIIADYIEAGYELKSVPDDWRERVAHAVEATEEKS